MRNIVRNIQKGKKKFQAVLNKTVNRFQQNAARLEHVNIKNKHKQK